MFGTGGITLLCARDAHHTLLGKKYQYRVWVAGCPEPGKNRCMDIVQVICIDQQFEAEVDKSKYFQDANKSYDKDTQTVIYAHPLLEDGMFTSGYVLSGNKQLVEFLDSLNHQDQVQPKAIKFMAGLFLDIEERKLSFETNQMNERLLHELIDVHWHKVHPSNLFTNCFDGYGMVDIQNLYSLRVDLNDLNWIDLNRQQVRWLETAGMRYFPMIIHPFRIDSWTISARWEQPTDYPEIYQFQLWADPKVPGDSACGCGYLKKKNNKPPSSLHMELIKEVVVRKQLKYLYYNQNREAIRAAYTSNGIGKFHVYLSSEFCTRVTQLMTESGLHLTAEQYLKLQKHYNKVMADQITKEQDNYDKLCDKFGEKRQESFLINMQRNAAIGQMAVKLGLIDP